MNLEYNIIDISVTLFRFSKKVYIFFFERIIRIIYNNIIPLTYSL